MPLQFNPITNEHYLTLPAPYQNLIITPIRQTDGPLSMEILNHPSVYKNLSGPAFPYTEEAWNNWYAYKSKLTQQSLEEYLAVEEARRKGEEGKWVGTGQPMTMIREVNAEGGDVLVGEISIWRSPFEPVDAEEEERVQGLNDGLEAGNEGIQWEVGFYLSVAAHGRGIMPAALRTLIESFYVPYMNVHLIKGAYFDFNAPSKRVFEKVGFVLDKMLPEFIELSEAKFGIKGKKVGYGIMKWTQ